MLCGSSIRWSGPTGRRGNVKQKYMSKLISVLKLKNLAEMYDGEFVSDLHPSIDFGGYGFESTEITEDGMCYGFRFYGDPAKMPMLSELWTELTVVATEKKPLTMQMVFDLIGKTVILNYSDLNEGSYKLKIVGIEKTQNSQVGQHSQYVLISIMEGETEENRNFYEWQGIFRRGSGAERLFLTEIID